MKNLLLISVPFFICFSLLNCEKDDGKNINKLGMRTECDTILTLDVPSSAGYPLGFPHDPFELDTTFVENDCIYFAVKYSGGCKEHGFKLGLVYYSSLSNHYVLTHDANGDLCEAYITDTVSFNLTTIQDENSSQITIHVGTYMTELTNDYTITYSY